MVESREEAVFGYRDCLAALKHGLWEDASKLLSIHGAKISTEKMGRFVNPARYHLHFFECALCGHHAARLTTDELVDGNWEQQPRMGEAFWGTPGTQPSQVSKLAETPRAFLRLFSEFRVPRINRVSMLGSIIAVCLVVTLGTIAAVYRRNRLEKEATAASHTLRSRLLLEASVLSRQPERALAYLAKAMRLTLDGEKKAYNEYDRTSCAAWITMTLTSHAWRLPGGSAVQKNGSPGEMRLEHRGDIYSAVFSSDGRRVVTSTADRMIRVWDFETGIVGSPMLHVHEFAASSKVAIKNIFI